MGLIANPKKVVVNIKLQNGTTTTGAVKTVNVSLGSLNTATFDLAKVFAIKNILEMVFEKSIYAMEKVATDSLDDDE